MTLSLVFNSPDGHQKTGVFDQDVRRPQLTIDQLQKMAPGINASILRAVDDMQVDQTTEHVWKETWLEVEKGWLSPATTSSGCSVAKRFGLQQGSKIRMIDDFSISKVNHTYGLRERLRVQAVDELCAYLAVMMDETEAAAMPTIKGRTFDLKSAYKQYGVDAWHSDFYKFAFETLKGDTACSMCMRSLSAQLGASLASYESQMH